MRRNHSQQIAFKPRGHEESVLKFWKKQKFQLADLKSNLPKATILMPPPNVTGNLHLGHAWDNILQDMMYRGLKIFFHKKFNPLFIPGVDHAGIATQAKVESALWKNLHLTRTKLGKLKFLQLINEFKIRNEKQITDQWQQMGILCHKNLFIYTKDNWYANAVQQAFIDLYQKKLVYQDYKLVNWDPKLQTVISDIEVNYQTQPTKLYYIKYYLVNDRKSWLEVATSRPETIFSDVAIFVHPADQRYLGFHQEFVINPLTNAQLQILTDPSVDQQFGSGVVKCSPCHDFTDYQLAQQHHLSLGESCIDQNNTMINVPSAFLKLDYLQCRKEIIEFFQNQNLIVKIVEYQSQLPFSQRSGSLVQPLCSYQWFFKSSVFFNLTKNYEKYFIDLDQAKSSWTFTNLGWHDAKQWTNKMQDWCISRQLWWGHQIPIWTNKITKATMLSLKPLNKKLWTPSEDVLDTWFSSGLWSILALSHPNLRHKTKTQLPVSPTPKQNYLLITGSDLIFFWVLRMSFFHQFYAHTWPFQNLWFHPLVTDQFNKKMSKSLDNGINPLILIKKYGCDALRFYFISKGLSTSNLRFLEKDLKIGQNFCHKLWNAWQFLKLHINSHVWDWVNNHQFETLIAKELPTLLKTLLISDMYQTINDFAQNYYGMFYHQNNTIKPNDHSQIIIYQQLFHGFFEGFFNRFFKAIYLETLKLQIAFVYGFLLILKLLFPIIPHFCDYILWQLHHGKISFLSLKQGTLLDVLEISSPDSKSEMYFQTQLSKLLTTNHTFWNNLTTLEFISKDDELLINEILLPKTMLKQLYIDVISTTNIFDDDQIGLKNYFLATHSLPAKLPVAVILPHQPKQFKTTSPVWCTPLRTINHGQITFRYCYEVTPNFQLSVIQAFISTAITMCENDLLEITHFTANQTFKTLNPEKYKLWLQKKQLIEDRLDHLVKTNQDLGQWIKN